MSLRHNAGAVCSPASIRLLPCDLLVGLALLALGCALPTEQILMLALRPDHFGTYIEQFARSGLQVTRGVLVSLGICLGSGLLRRLWRAPAGRVTSLEDSRASAWWSSAVVVIALLGLIAFHDRPPMMDELITAEEVIGGGWLRVLSGIDSFNNHVLYSVLTKLQFAGFGKSEWTLRIVAFLSGAAVGLALFRLSRRFVPDGWAAVIALAWALNPMAIKLGTMGRGYSLAQALMLFGLDQLGRGLATERRRHFFVWSILSVLAACAHLSAAVAPVAAVLALILGHVVFGRRLLPGSTLRLLLAGSLSGLLLAGLLVGPRVPALLSMFRGTFLRGSAKIAADWPEKFSASEVQPGAEGGYYWIFVGLMAVGVGICLRRHRALGVALLGSTLGTVVAAAKVAANLPSRFGSVVAPLWTFFAALSVAVFARKLAPRRPALQTLVAALVLGMVLVLGWEGFQQIRRSSSCQFRDVIAVADHAPGPRRVCLIGRIAPLLRFWRPAWAAVDSVAALERLDASGTPWRAIASGPMNARSVTLRDNLLGLQWIMDHGTRVYPRTDDEAAHSRFVIYDSKPY